MSKEGKICVIKIIVIKIDNFVDNFIEVCFDVC